ncbi:MAG: 4-(cytidine 5'-diphospho)-2-C-methyl-D-erythritol kinase [bacterium]|nr:4-(cytidine 5'-diphospho)-2-C-methyl-D-erythritol kinase [bacterium]
MIRLLAPAKVNLTLKVLGKRPDGYHDIESLVQKVSLYDRITIREVSDPGIHVTCSDPTVPSGPGNLVYQAAQLIMEATRTAGKGISIDLEKRIPHGAGLGGGSSDAAAVIMGLNTLWNLSLSLMEMEEVAARIGSDVPLFLHPSPSVISGRGEVVTPAPARIRAVFLIVFPGFSVSTRWAYSNFRLTKDHGKYRISALQRAERGELPPDRWQGFIVNDLEAAVSNKHPEIGRCIEDLLLLGAGASQMSGSGSAVFGLFEDRFVAQKAASSLLAGGGRAVFITMPLFS